LLPSHNSIELLPSRSTARVRFCVAAEIERISKTGQLVFLTLTFPDAPNFSEAKKRWNSLNTNWGQRWGEPLTGVVVWEQHKSGFWHVHITAIAWRAWDGHWSHTRNGWRYYGGKEDLLFWAQFRDWVAGYGFGRTQCVPVRDNTETAAARYVAKYVSKDRPAEAKGKRLVEFLMRRKWHYERGLERRTSTRFGWATFRAALWRQAVQRAWLARGSVPTLARTIQAAARIGVGLGWIWKARDFIGARLLEIMSGSTTFT
jgi:hypothetical protein